MTRDEFVALSETYKPRLHRDFNALYPTCPDGFIEQVYQDTVAKFLDKNAYKDVHDEANGGNPYSYIKQAMKRNLLNAFKAEACRPTWGSSPLPFETPSDQCDEALSDNTIDAIEMRTDRGQKDKLPGPFWCRQSPENICLANETHSTIPAMRQNVILEIVELAIDRIIERCRAIGGRKGHGMILVLQGVYEQQVAKLCDVSPAAVSKWKSELRDIAEEELFGVLLDHPRWLHFIHTGYEDFYEPPTPLYHFRLMSGTLDLIHEHMRALGLHDDPCTRSDPPGSCNGDVLLVRRLEGQS